MRRPLTDSLAVRKSRPHTYDATLQGHRLTLAYRGTDFYGWQRQPDKRTVQEEIEKALAKIWGAKIDLQGSGRTDTGVHGLGQVASFNARRLHNAVVLQRALNANLPPDVRVVKCRLVHPSFHARFQSKEKTYRYLVWNDAVQDPFTIDTHWYVMRPLDLAAMRKAARVLLGEHDFASFTSNTGYARESTVRTIRRIGIVRKGPAISFDFTADGFLFRMVRNLVGALAKVGLGKMNVEELQAVLEAKKRSVAPATAPACGLYLLSVKYPPLVPPK